jgi:hypothetical protein
LGRYCSPCAQAESACTWCEGIFKSIEIEHHDGYCQYCYENPDSAPLRAEWESQQESRKLLGPWTRIEDGFHPQVWGRHTPQGVAVALVLDDEDTWRIVVIVRDGTSESSRLTEEEARHGADTQLRYAGWTLLDENYREVQGELPPEEPQEPAQSRGERLRDREL